MPCGRGPADSDRLWGKDRASFRGCNVLQWWCCSSAKRSPASNLAGQNGQTLTYTAEVATGQWLSAFLVVNGSLNALLDANPSNDPTVFFNHIAANSDGQDHVRLLGDNVFGLEDIFGGGDQDCNDVIVKIAVA